MCYSQIFFIVYQVYKVRVLIIQSHSEINIRYCL